MIAPHRPISLATLPDYARDRLAAAQRYPEERLRPSRIALPKLDLDILSSEPELPELCESRLVPRAAGEAATSSAKVFLMDATLEGWEAPATWDVETGFTSRDFDRVLANSGLRGFYHHDMPSWQFYDPASHVGVHTMPGPMAVPPWEGGSPLRLFLHWAWAQQNSRLTHAATLGIDGRGALMVGASGSGKSGTTLAGLLNGLTSAGDDYVLVEAGASVTAHAVYRVFKQDAAGLRRAGIDPGDLTDATLNWRGKLEFDALKLKPQAFVSKLSVQAILLPEIARLSRTRIESVSAKHAALALAPSAVFQLPGDADGAFGFFAQLTRRLPAFRIRLSENPAEIADAIGALLSKEMASAC